MIEQSHRWQKTAVAAAAIALLGLAGTGASALSLGRVTVQSALGEPLRAEVEVPDINAEEASSLKAGVASPDAFVAAGLEYNAAMPSLKATLQRRANGTSFLRLVSERAVNEPFVDVILEASWSSGRVVRDYTLLFDPPGLHKPTLPPTLPQASATVSEGASASVVDNPPPAKSSSTTTIASSKGTNVRTKPAKAVPAEPTAESIDSSKQIVVKAGDTASKIAATVKPAGVSLDQMLVALLRSNPDAFVNENINRIRSGAVLNVPTGEQAQAVSTGEATQTVLAQSKDFNEFRRNLASNAPKTASTTPDRESSGAVEAKVDDKKPAKQTPDVLTLSKGSAQAQANADRIAKERAEKEEAVRTAEIAKNLQDLKKITAAASTPATPSPVTPIAKAASDAKPPESTQAIASPPPQEAAASEPAVTASAVVPAVSTPAKPVVAPVVPVAQEQDFFAQLMDNPAIPLAGVGVLALLGGFGVYRMRQRKKNAGHVDSSFLESRLQPDSFFGASGGQRVDTSNSGNPSVSSMVYSASQLDAADDVDPVAEADVYLAYGRDLQAEEILKEAVRSNPSRLAIHTKLLEIFAKRRDTKAFESSAIQAYKLAGANSPEWTRICEMGLGIDPGNALYQPGGAPYSSVAAPNTGMGGGSTIPVPKANIETALPAADATVDLDLDLDFSMDEEPVKLTSDATDSSATYTSRSEQTIALNATHPATVDMDLALPEATAEIPSVKDPLPDLSLDLAEPSLNMSPQESRATTPSPIEPAEAIPDGMLAFDLNSMSLELEATPDQASPAPDMMDDPLATKLALAEEFVSIGDEDGARALIEEVMAEATGDMRAKAQRALANLS